MRLSRPLTFVIIAFDLFLFGLGIAFANGPEIGFDAGTIYPVNSRNIQLVSESVIIDLLPGLDWRFTPEQGGPPPGPNAVCTYVLRNLSDSTRTFAMAFVSNTPYGAGGSPEIQGLYDANRFEVAQDGRPREVKFLPGRGKDFQSEFGTDEMVFPTWSLTIGPSAISVIQMRYNTSWSGGSDGETAGSDFTYHARPAARWAGRIEQATFVLRLGDPGFVRRLQRKGAPWEVHVAPAGYQWTQDGLEWKFNDWEPDSDLRLMVEFPTSDVHPDPSWSPWTPDSIAAMPEVTANLDRAPVVKEGQACIPTSDLPAVTIRLRVLVTKAGTVDQIRFLKRPESGAMLDEAWSCVRLWYFEPAMRAGHPVSAWTDVVVSYPARY